MATKHQARQILEQAFRSKHVLDLQALKAALGAVSRTTVFRALVKVGYLTSYSHRGGFYTLEQIPDFNEDGIWTWGDVMFSRWHTLRATVSHMVNEAPAGRTHAELQARTHLRVHDTLHDLLAADEIGRVVFNHRFVYVSGDNETAQAQIREREASRPGEDDGSPAPDPQVVVDVLLAFIDHSEEGVDRLAVRLRRHGVTREQVDNVFRLYELEKKTALRRLPR